MILASAMDTRLKIPMLAVGGLLLLGLLCSTAQSAASPAGITGFRYWSGPDHTRLVVDMQGEAEYKAFSMRQPKRLVIDLSNARMEFQKTAPTVGGEMVNQVRFGA